MSFNICLFLSILQYFVSKSSMMEIMSDIEFEYKEVLIENKMLFPDKVQISLITP